MVITYSKNGISNDPFSILNNQMERLFFPVGAHVKQAAYPPHNVIKIDDDNFIMEFAVAGFKKEEIDISVKDNIISIVGEREEDTERHYIHKGIAGRKFSRSFYLPKYVEVKHAGYDSGVLYIDLVRNVPEEKKPISIKID